MDDTLLTIADAAARTGLLPAELYREVTAGRLAPSSESAVRFTADAVDAWLRLKTDASGELAGHAAAVMEEEDDSLPDVPASVAGILVKVCTAGAAGAVLRTADGTVILTGTDTDMRLEFGTDAGRMLMDDVRTRAGIAAGSVGTGVFVLPDTDPAVQVMAHLLPGTDGPFITLTFRTGVPVTGWEDAGCTAVQAAALRRALTLPGSIVLLADPDGTVFGTAADILAGGAADGTPPVTVEHGVHFNHAGTVRLRVDPADGTRSFPALMRAAAGAGRAVLVDGIASADDARAVLEAAAAGMCVAVCMPAADTADLLVRWLAFGVSKELSARYLTALAAWQRVPAVCAGCAVERKLTAGDAARFGLEAGTAVKDTAGCPACGGTVLADIWAAGDAAALVRVADPANPDALRTAAVTVPTGLVCTASAALRDGLIPFTAAAALVVPAGQPHSTETAQS